MNYLLFNDDMIRALLDGSKTQDRRIIAPQPVWNDPERPGMWQWKSRLGAAAWGGPEEIYNELRPMLSALYHGFLPSCPYGSPGSLLWVRECWCQPLPDGPLAYRATDQWRDTSLQPGAHPSTCPAGPRA